MKFAIRYDSYTTEGAEAKLKDDGGLTTYVQCGHSKPLQKSIFI